MKKIWKYIVGFFTIVIGGLLAFLSGRSAGKKDDIIFDAVIKPVWDKLPFGK